MLAKYIVKGLTNNINSNLLIRGLSTYKTSTGLVGIPVDVNGRENLIKMSNKVLDSVTVSNKSCKFSLSCRNIRAYFVLVRITFAG